MGPVSATKTASSVKSAATAAASLLLTASSYFLAIRIKLLDYLWIDRFFHRLFWGVGLIVGQTTCFGISQAPGNVRVARVRRNALRKGPLSDTQRNAQSSSTVNDRVGSPVRNRCVGWLFEILLIAESGWRILLGSCRLCSLGLIQNCRY
jgi:hypothetical protein